MSDRRLTGSACNWLRTEFLRIVGHRKSDSDIGSFVEATRTKPGEVVPTRAVGLSPFSYSSGRDGISARDKAMFGRAHSKLRGVLNGGIIELYVAWNQEWSRSAM